MASSGWDSGRHSRANTDFAIRLADWLLDISSPGPASGVIGHCDEALPSSGWPPGGGFGDPVIARCQR